MISDDELWNKCASGDSGEDITAEDLGIHPNLYKCHTIIECGFRTFYTDGTYYYDINGNPVSFKDRKKYNLI